MYYGECENRELIAIYCGIGEWASLNNFALYVINM